MQVLYHSTNNPNETVNFETALLNGMASNYGLYMFHRRDTPKLSPGLIRDMGSQSYAEIAFQVLNPFLGSEIPREKLEAILNDAYREDKIPTQVQHVTGNTHIMWLTKGPTYSFKDYAARFFGRALNHFLAERGLKRTVIVATSGDTYGAIAHALYQMDAVDSIGFFPKGSVSNEQRRQMTTLRGNIHAFEINGDFDVCQALAKYIMGDKKFTFKVFGDENRFTSANSISVGRLLPQTVYPFFAYSRVAEFDEPMIASIPSGNFGDMMGTVISKEMGLPISKILVGLNPNKQFLNFLETGRYKISESIDTPSSAMRVSHPSNLARLSEFYGGHMFDQGDPKTNQVIREGVIGKMPDLEGMRRDFFAFSIPNPEHYNTMRDVFGLHGVILDPHGAVAWKTLDEFLNRAHNRLAVVYETADPGKFPQDIRKALGFLPKVPPGIQEQEKLEERIYSIESEPERIKDQQTGKEKLKLSQAQIEEAKSKINGIFS